LFVAQPGFVRLPNGMLQGATDCPTIDFGSPQSWLLARLSVSPTRCEF
jgi:hypothetical protein